MVSEHWTDPERLRVILALARRQRAVLRQNPPRPRELDSLAARIAQVADMPAADLQHNRLDILMGVESLVDTPETPTEATAKSPQMARLE